MKRYIAQRLMQGVVLLVLVAMIVFFLGRLTGNPLDLMLPEDATAPRTGSCGQSAAASLALLSVSTAAPRRSMGSPRGVVSKQSDRPSSIRWSVGCSPAAPVPIHSPQPMPT